MPKGKYPSEYFHNPDIHKSIEDIYSDLDAYTSEIFEDEYQIHQWIEFNVILPPLFYKGHFVKGIFMSQAVDYLIKIHPVLSDLFFSMATSMWCSYPWSKSADAFLTCYDNPQKSEWFKRGNPVMAHKIFIPLQNADFTNEKIFVPTREKKRDFDILCISRLQDLKNLPLIANALKIYHQKYRKKLKAVFMIGKSVNSNNDNKEINEEEQKEMKKIESVFKHPKDYIQFLPPVLYHQLPRYYSRAKACVLGSLIEGKNRSLHEAMLCDTPIIVFKDYNKYARNGYPVFPYGAGLYAPEFNGESLADTIFTIINNTGEFNPRKIFLPVSGRYLFLKKCMESIPYYKTEIPYYSEGDIVSNPWIASAMQDNYQITLDDFLYRNNNPIQQMLGLKGIKKFIDCFQSVNG